MSLCHIMPLVELDPEIALAAIEGQVNLLEGEQKKADAFYRQFICPSCKSGSLSKRFDPRHAFADSDWLIARATLICNECGCHFDPHSGLLLEPGKPRIPIIGTKPFSSER
jgi:acetone carboxylase gamma subunit